MKKLNIILFDGITLLDAIGPVDVLSRVSDEFEINWYSENPDININNLNITIKTLQLNEHIKSEILLIPGGIGTRNSINNVNFINKINILAQNARYILTICTGSVLLAKTGILNGKHATSNKKSWDWVIKQNNKVYWEKEAKWVKCNNIYTSSGVTSGIDMALAFINDIYGSKQCETICRDIEYNWNKDRGLII